MSPLASLLHVQNPVHENLVRDERVDRRPLDAILHELVRWVVLVDLPGRELLQVDVLERRWYPEDEKVRGEHEERKQRAVGEGGEGEEGRPARGHS